MASALNSYRRGNFGHNMPCIQEAIGQFTQALDYVSDDTEDDTLFFLNFYLARCYAERYETARAIKHFKEAVRLRPNDIDSNMGLLAEYSVLVNTNTDQLSVDVPADWRSEYEMHIDSIRRRFPKDSDAAKQLEAHLDPSTDPGLVQALEAYFENTTDSDKDGIPSQPKDAVTRMRPALFRWKMK
jgi:tetratricopeptide (TPR) repeat protein